MKNLDQMNAVPSPPTRHTSFGASDGGVPPPPPVRKDSKKSNSSTSSISPTHGLQLGGKPLPPPPQHRTENTNIEKNKSIPPPPQISNRQLLSDNGHEDYDVPRPLTNRFSDYDVPRNQAKREAKEKFMKDPSGEYNIPISREERQRRENMDSSLSGSASRPVSTASSVFSADASTISSQSSRSSKHGGPSEEESGHISPSNLDQQLEMIDQLVGDVAAMNSAKKSSPSTSLNALSTIKTVDEDASSHYSSGDNLGVWDDVSSEPDSDETESEFSACS